ncbi:MAG: hypothetical protein ABW275_07925 [Hansschlegelia sp.]
MTAGNESPRPEQDRTLAAKRLEAAGRELFGERFHAALARELNVSRSLVVAMVNDKRRLTPEIERRLSIVIRSEALPKLESKVATLTNLADAIDQKLGSYLSNAAPR